MKIEAKFYSEKNKIYFLNGTELNTKNKKIIDGKCCKNNSEPEENALYSINVTQELTGTEENANEEFLAEFRDWLKKLEDKNSFAIIIPFAENASSTQEQKEIFTASFKHCARRIKDCENVIGFSVPENVEPDFFISELKAKHGHYIFFSTDENLLVSDEKIAKL